MDNDTTTMNDHELLVRIDERVKQLCESTDNLRKDLGKQDERISQNKNLIENNESKVSWNRRILAGLLVTVVGGIMLAMLLQGASL